MLKKKQENLIKTLMARKLIWVWVGGEGDGVVSEIHVSRSTPKDSLFVPSFSLDWNYFTGSDYELDDFFSLSTEFPKRLPVNILGSWFTGVNEA